MVIHYHYVFVTFYLCYWECFCIIAESFSIDMDDLGVEISFLDWYEISCHFINLAYWCTLVFVSDVLSCGYAVSICGCGGGLKVFGQQL